MLPKSHIKHSKDTEKDVKAEAESVNKIRLVLAGDNGVVDAKGETQEGGSEGNKPKEVRSCEIEPY